MTSADRVVSRPFPREPFPVRRWAFVVAALAVIGYLALYGAWLIFRWGGPDLEVAINDFAFLPLGIAAVAFALVARARASSIGSRRAWLVLALAFAAFWLGDAIWFYLEVIAAGELPYPSLADVGYLSFYPLAVVGLLCLSRERTVSRLGAVLDLAIVLVGAGTIVWILVLAPVAAAEVEDPLALATSLAYPLGDALVLFALAAALMRRLSDTPRVVVFLLSVGLLLNIVADLSYARVALEDTYESGQWLDLAWMAGWAAMALAPLAQVRSTTQAAVTGEAPARAQPISLLPYGAVVILFVFLLGAAATGSVDTFAVVVGAVLATGLVLVRQVLMVRENARVEARFRALIENASDVIAVTDRAGTVTQVTPSVMRVLGRSPESLIGRPLRSILDAEQGAAATAFLLVAASHPGPSGPVEWRLAPSGTAPRTVDVTVTNLLHDPFVDGLVVTIRDVTERKSFEQQLQHQAFHDPLTGLANRALLANRVEHALSRSRRRTTRPAVIYLDLDDFKRVNDSQGHNVGDHVLLEVARRITRVIREVDTAARLGGDEFAVLIEETSAVEEVEAVAGRIRDELARPVEVEHGRVVVGASMGIVRDEGQDAGMMELLRDADIAMYEAKRATRGSWRVFEPAMFSETVDRVRLEDDLRQALAKHEFALVFQPLEALATGQIAGAEALLRWHHPGRGTIMPLDFIPIAEEIGEIIPIGAWVLEEACGIVGAWNRGRDTPIRASVNVSARQLGPTFVTEVLAILASTGFPAELLVLELTESVLAENRPELIQILAELRRHGIRISIDDFGTGYSSLSYLSHLPIDEIKIDRSFVQALSQEGSTNLVASIIQMAHRMGIPTVAEGIEQEAQVQALRALGCELGQGYLIGRPMPHRDTGPALNVPRPWQVQPRPATPARRTA